MRVQTDRTLIRIESLYIAGMIILSQGIGASQALIIISELLLVNLFFSLEHIGALRLHRFRLLDLSLELVLIISAVQITSPVMLLACSAFWFYRLFDRMSPQVSLPTALAAMLLHLPWFSGQILPAHILMICGTAAAAFAVAAQEKSYLDSLLEQQNTLQLQIQSKNKVLSTLSHELRTPLTVIQTSTEILKEERPGPVNETQQKFLDSTHANVRRMIRLVENILAQIKVEHTLFTLEKDEIDIRVVIRRVVRNMRPFLDDQQQEVRYSFSNFVDHVDADAKWIEQVLINLIHNASKHVGVRGSILLTVKQNEQCVVVSVSDNGSGIELGERPKVFDEFYQGADAGNDSQEGSGLGLAIVRDIIEKHQGKIYLSSFPNQGTIVSFTLPKKGAAS